MFCSSGGQKRKKNIQITLLGEIALGQDKLASLSFLESFITNLSIKAFMTEMCIALVIIFSSIYFCFLWTSESRKITILWNKSLCQPPHLHTASSFCMSLEKRSPHVKQERGKRWRNTIAFPLIPNRASLLSD